MRAHRQKAIERDKDLLAYQKSVVRFPLPGLAAGKGLHILRGPRQVGKTTLVKNMIKERLEAAEPDGVFYFSADSGYPLDLAIREYLDFTKSDERAMFLDEVTADGRWATKIKYLIDSGRISGEDTIVVTASSSIDLKEGARGFPEGLWRETSTCSTRILSGTTRQGSRCHAASGISMSIQRKKCI